MRLCQEYQHFISLKSYDFLQGNNCILERDGNVDLSRYKPCSNTKSHLYVG